jgi:OmpA-OmpF porin, OOP family
VIATSSDGTLAADAKLTVRLADEPRPLELVLSPTRAVLAGEEVLIQEMVQFDFNQATLGPASGAVLDEVARVLLAVPDVVRLEVQGHTDTIGALPVNQALSQQRAEAVVAALVARGVQPEKLLARGYGPTRPIGTNDTDEGRAQNRRVQFEIVERAAR